MMTTQRERIATTTCRICGGEEFAGNWLRDTLLGVFCLSCGQYYEKPTDEDEETGTIVQSDQTSDPRQADRVLEVM